MIDLQTPKEYSVNNNQFFFDEMFFLINFSPTSFSNVDVSVSFSNYFFRNNCRSKSEMKLKTGELILRKDRFLRRTCFHCSESLLPVRLSISLKSILENKNREIGAKFEKQKQNVAAAERSDVNQKLKNLRLLFFSRK